MTRFPVRRTALIAAFAMALTAALPAAAAAEESRTVLLKERTVTENHVITLGDLFEDAGEAGDTVVARAPSLGQRVSLDPAHVQREAARHGLHWSNALGRERITVERAARQISASELSELIGAEIYGQTGRPHEITLANRSMSLHAPMSSEGGPEIVRLDLDARGGQFRAEITAWPGGDPVTVAGRAESVTDVPVLVRQIGRGEIIEAHDVEWVRLRAASVRHDAILNESALVGREARRALRPGEALRAYDVSAPNAISRGETISLVFQVSNMTLTARARALENAAEGQTARFQNLQSNRTVEAVVTGPGQARVGGAAGIF